MALSDRLYIYARNIFFTIFALVMGLFVLWLFYTLLDLILTDGAHPFSVSEPLYNYIALG